MRGNVVMLKDGVGDSEGQNVIVVDVPSVGKTVTNGDGMPSVGPTDSDGGESPVKVLKAAVVDDISADERVSLEEGGVVAQEVDCQMVIVPRVPLRLVMLIVGPAGRGYNVTVVSIPLVE